MTAYDALFDARAHPGRPRAGAPPGLRGRCGRPRPAARRRPSGRAPVRGDGADLPAPARAGGRLRQERRRHRRAGARSASATSRSARSPGSRSRATRGRGCSGCPPTGRWSTGWASTTTAPRSSPRRLAARRAELPRGRGPRASTSARPRWCPRTTRRRSGRLREERRACWRRTPTTWSSTSPRPTRPGCATCRRSSGSARCWRRCATRADQVTGDRRVPLLVKIAPDLADDDVLAVADLALELGLDGIIATNTTISRDGLRHAPPPRSRPLGAGGLSGAPLRERALEVLRLLRERVGPDLTLIGVGGITTRRGRRRAGRGRRHAAAGLHRASSTAGRCGRAGS